MNVNGINYSVQVKIEGDYSWNDLYLTFNYSNMADAMRTVEAFLVDIVAVKDKAGKERPVEVTIVPELIKDEPEEAEPEEEEADSE